MGIFASSQVLAGNNGTGMLFVDNGNRYTSFGPLLTSFPSDNNNNNNNNNSNLAINE